MAMESLSIMDELDSEPTLEEINQALDQLFPGKAPGNDGIAVEVTRCAKGTLFKELHEILCQCWREGEVPQDMGMLTSSGSTRTRVKWATVTITAASLSAISLANSSPKLSL